MTLTGPGIEALLLTLQLAGITTVLLLIIGLPLAWWLAAGQGPLRRVTEAIVALPLVLPPTVLGFYLLVALSPTGPVGQWIEALGGPRLVFSFPGLVLGSLVYSLPFTVQPLQSQFETLDRRILEAAATLRAGPLDRFLTVVLPITWPGALTAMVLTFAHTLGEFGVVLMIGGNIPGETRVASIAIYEAVESLDYGTAHGLSAVLLVSAFLLLITIYGLRPRATQR